MHTVDFKNTIIILTSNLAGSDLILDGIGGEQRALGQLVMRQLLDREVRPEFLNRLDEIVFYKPLTSDVCSGSSICLSLVSRASSKRNSLRSPTPRKRLCRQRSAAIHYGARPLKRFLQSRVRSAWYIIRTTPKPESTLTVDLSGEKLFVR